MKIVFLLRFACSNILLLLTVSSAFAQPKLSLTKNQMYADFDTLVATISRVSPHLPIKKDLWKYDGIAEMKSQRKYIDTVQSDMAYFMILLQVLQAAQDMHTSIMGNSKGWGATQYQAYRSIRNGFKLSMGHIYANGKYYTTDPFMINADTIAIGTEITQLNGIAIDDYIRTHIWARNFSYDVALHKFFGPGFFKNTATMFSDSLTFTFKTTTGKVKDYRLPTKEFTKYLPSPRYNDSTRVEYWEPERILYIRLTEMDTRYKSLLSSAISKYKNKSSVLDKIIIDIRDNPGGEDNVWLDLFAELIDSAISYPLKIDGFQHVMSTEQIEKFGIKTVTIARDRDALLKPYHFYTLANTTEQLVPSPTSIKFKGKIFVLAENHYSSAGSAMAVANANPNDQLISVGRKTGDFLGIGFSPQTFVLPNTGLSYRIAPSIEVTNAHSLQDLMHDDMEIYVPHDIGYYIKKFDYKGELTSKAFLLQHDPFIKEVLAR